MAQLQDRARLWRWYGVELIDIRHQMAAAECPLTGE
jgi:hypothetical protein